MRLVAADRLAAWNTDWSLAVVFGLVSIPWTYGFALGDLPLWPSFIAAATFYAAGGGLGGLARGYAANLTGVLYAALTLAAAGALGGGPVTLSVVVGLFMFVASLHAFVPLLSFTPGAFFGYATMFSVHAAGATALTAGLPGETLATIVSMLVGALIGLGAERASLAAAEPQPS